jgi:hypothetical protein
MRFSEMPTRWARQIAGDRWLAVEIRQDPLSSNSARPSYTFSMRVRFHFGMSQKNRTNKKRKIKQKEAKETKGFRIRIFSKVIQWFPACPRDVRRALRSGRNQNRSQPLGAPFVTFATFCSTPLQTFCKTAERSSSWT